MKRMIALLAVASAAVVALGSTAAATSLAPTVSSAFTPNPIGVGETAALGITIVNPNASGTLSAIAFTDTLPAGVTVDNPNGESGTCGSSGVVTATSGSSTISLTGGSLKAGANCLVSVDVIASSAGVVTDNTGPITSSGTTNQTGASASVDVLDPPTVTVSGPTNNAKYAYGQRVQVIYGCAQAGYNLGLSGCTASDDLGNNISSGGFLDTRVPGAHELDVFASSIDGLVTDDTIDYTVLPNNKFSVSGVKAGSRDSVKLKLALPGPGKVKIVERAGKSVVATKASTIRASGTVHLKLSPSSAEVTKLGSGSVRVKLTITYTPKGGTPSARTAHAKIG
jgi:hypothetical protein